MDRMNYAIADKVVPETRAVDLDAEPKPDLNKAILAVRGATAAPVKAVYEATYVPRKATETGLQATGVTKSPEEKKDLYIQAQRQLMDQYKYDAEQQRIENLRQRLIKSN